MAFFPEFCTVVVVHLFAVMSPGPDFILISRNSLVYARHVGVYAALGLSLGIVVHVTYSLIGIGLLIAQSPWLYTLLQYAGAAYLVYLGSQCLRAAPSPAAAVAAAEDRAVGNIAAIRMGFLTNVLNPKATLFFFALFTQVIDPRTPKFIQLLYGLEMSLMTFAWFAFVATVLSHPRIRARFASVQQRLERTFGVILIALAVKVAFAPAG